MTSPISEREASSLEQLLGAADHIDRLLAAKTAEQAVELAAELLLATSGASGVVVFATGPDGLDEQWAAGQLEGGEDDRRALAAKVIEHGKIVLKDSMCALPLSAGRVYAVLVAQGGAQIKAELASLLTSLGSRGLEAAALRVAAAKQQQLRLSLNRYLNPTLVRTIIRGSHTVATAPSVRPISVLSLVVEGFSEQMDLIGPEKLLPVAHQYFTTLADTIYEREGTLIDYGLHGTTAVFGAPISSDDATGADLAASAGLKLLEKLHDLADRWGIEGLPIHFDVRAGVSSGPAMVGAFGATDRPVFSALGPYVTLGKKLAQQGEMGELVVDSTTRTLLAERLSTRSIGAVEVQGLDYPIFAYAAEQSVK